MHATATAWSLCWAGYAAGLSGCCGAVRSRRAPGSGVRARLGAKRRLHRPVRIRHRARSAHRRFRAHGGCASASRSIRSSESALRRRSNARMAHDRDFARAERAASSDRYHGTRVRASQLCVDADVRRPLGERSRSSRSRASSTRSTDLRIHPARRVLTARLRTARSSVEAVLARSRQESRRARAVARPRTSAAGGVRCGARQSKRLRGAPEDSIGESHRAGACARGTVAGRRGVRADAQALRGLARRPVSNGDRVVTPPRCGCRVSMAGARGPSTAISTSSAWPGIRRSMHLARMHAAARAGALRITPDCRRQNLARILA